MSLYPVFAPLSRSEDSEVIIRDHTAGHQGSTAERAGLGAHLPALDGLRGIAILVVMVMHFTFVAPGSPSEHLFAGIIRSGWVGVDLFFVLSGFLITGILVDSRLKENYFRTFYMRRAVRIFPLYYAFLFLLFVILPWLKPGSSLAENGTDPQLWAWAYLNNVLMAREGWEGVSAHTTHLWSLAIEEQFYLVWPLIVWSATRQTLIRICAVLIVAAWATRLSLFYSTGMGIGGYLLFPARMDALVFGGVLALLVREPAGVAGMVRFIRPATALAMTALFATVAWTVLKYPPGTYLPPLDLHVQLFGYPAVALLSGAGLVAALDRSTYPRLNQMLCSPILMRFGKYSYGLYILHILLRDLAWNRLFAGGTPVLLGSQVWSAILIVVAGITLSYAMAFISWHVYEKHFLRLKRFFPYSKDIPAEAIVIPDIDRRGIVHG